MTYSQLESTLNILKQYNKISHIKRIFDNIFKIEFKEDIYYFDMTKNKSEIFKTNENLISHKLYSAPFDLILKKLNNTDILDIQLVNFDRIIRFKLESKNTYKREIFYLQFEFSGKYTNAIILDENLIVLEALRHIPESKSIRIVKIGEKLENPPFKKQENNKLLTTQETLNLLESNYINRKNIKLNELKSNQLLSLNKQKQKLINLLESMPEKDILLNKSIELRNNATLLLNNIHILKPYETKITIKDFNNELKTIYMPQEKTPQIAINKMFNESKKLNKKAQNLHIQIENLNNKIECLNKEIEFIENNDNLDELELFKSSFKDKKDAKQNIGITIFIENFKVSIGRNWKENKALLESAKSEDMWLHIKDYPSSHMIIHSGKTKIPQVVLYKAGSILAHFSGLKTSNLQIDYTKRKFVKLANKANVTYAKEQSIFV